jgi:chromosome segregation ATPase
MSKTKTLPEGNLLEEARADLEAAQERVRTLESELAGVAGRIREIDWSDEEQAASHLAKFDARRNALPFLIREAKKAEAEAQIVELDLQMEEAEGQREPLNNRINELQEAYLKVRDELDGARDAFRELTIGRMSDIRRAKKETLGRLAAIEREAGSAVEQGAPVVRSVWQLHRENRDPGPSQESAGLAFGAGNVKDLPLSMQGSKASAPTVVIPQQAIANARNHAKKDVQRQRGGGGQGHSG